MPIRFECASCGKSHAVAEKFAGQRAKCSCGAVVNVPAASEPEEVAYDFADASEPAPIKPPPLRSMPMRAATPPARGGVASPPRPGAGRAKVQPAKDERGLLRKIGGGVVTALIILGVVGRIVRAINRSTSGDKQSSSYADTGRSRSSAAAAAPAVATFAPIAAPSNFPADATWISLPGGGRRMSVSIDNAAGLTTNLYVFLPKGASAEKKVPCVFVAPAGSRMFHGMALADGDVPEMTPYVDAGMAVVGYSIGGPLKEDDLENVNVARAAFATFRKSQGGLVDAEAAIAYALAKRPEVDAKRLFAAGHSSAASLALLVAAKDDRIKACCAYAPATDLVARNNEHVAELEEYLPGWERLSRDISPANLPVPAGDVLLFSAEDDDNVKTAEVRAYADKLAGHATLKTTPRGGHYESMVREGLPAGVAFLRERATRS